MSKEKMNIDDLLGELYIEKIINIPPKIQKEILEVIQANSTMIDNGPQKGKIVSKIFKHEIRRIYETSGMPFTDATFSDISGLLRSLDMNVDVKFGNALYVETKQKSAFQEAIEAILLIANKIRSSKKQKKSPKYKE